MQKDLGHLSSEEIEALMQRYYNGEAASRLIKEYKLSVRAAELYKLFPPEVYPNYSCEYCDEFLVINRPSKATKDFPKYERDLYCPICGHKPFQAHCRCQLSFSDRSRRVRSFSRSGDMVLIPRFGFLFHCIAENEFRQGITKNQFYKYYNRINSHKKPFALLLTQTMKRDSRRHRLRSPRSMRGRSSRR